jgi:hypothetical protein
MPLSPDFSFSQQNLQDYLDCPRRFQLRYIQRLAWPAVQSEPILEQERHMQLGERFHRLVQQHQLGLPAEVLESTAGSDPDLSIWWKSYLRNLPDDLPPQRKIEYLLSAPFAGFRLLAKYDLLAIEPGRCARILDWKTNRKRPAAARLRERVQTRLYPFLLVTAGAALNGNVPWQPEQVSLTYWFTAAPENPMHFQYSVAQFRDDEKLLRQWIDAIRRSADQPMMMTADERLCALCNYRSYCQRGQRAGVWDEEAGESEPEQQTIDFDFSQIDEIEF